MSLKKLLGTSLLCFSLVLSNVTALAADQNNVSDNKELTSETQEQTDTMQEVQTQSESQENEDGSATPEQSEENPDAQDTNENGRGEQTTEGQNEETQNTESEEAGVETQSADGVSLEQYAGGRTIQVDGDPKEWDGIPSYTSNDGSVAKWSVAQNDEYVYFYVQENGGNKWGLPITNTKAAISYASGLSNSNLNGIGFAFENSSLVLKDGWYGNINGTLSGFSPSQEQDKYEIEFAVPQSYFAESDYTLTYCGTSIASGDIPVLNTFPEYEEEKPVYNGITIDGNFSDWNAVEKTSVDDGSIIDAAMVFDGDWIYIYLKDTGNGAAFHAGERSHGTYELLTDTGRRTSFVLRENGIEGVKDAKVKYSNDQYEIAIPASNLKKYRSTISFGYAQAKTPMISGVSNLQGGGNIDGSFSGITIDGNFDDWADYNHQLIEYSTNGDYGDDADGALYLSDHTLYGHVKTYRLRNNNPYYQVELRFNEVDSQNIYFQFITVDDSGNINWNPQMDYDGTTKEYYMIDMRGWHGASTLTELEDEGYGNKILGHAYIRMGSSDDTELEYEIDLEKLSSYISTSNSTPYEMSVTDMKTIQAKYQNIGDQWVTIAGTSSGPVVGVVLCISTVACVLAYRRRKQKGIA